MNTRNIALEKTKIKCLPVLTMSMAKQAVNLHSQTMDILTVNAKKLTIGLSKHSLVFTREFALLIQRKYREVNG